ncbi:hypothetical protein [Actinoplanes rectilineatus]|uniref:hypothetical protein n=1 Tax=Actinoplanes rectilineatus TaxID=113571 RepID=UPI0005F2AE4A|nr:hypothetical protein [Actinoplanes rectilineatus]
MTLDEAIAHIGGPVLAHDFPCLFEGEIVEMDERRRMVRLRVRRKTMPYDFLARTQWWSPARLTVPGWWARRQACPAEQADHTAGRAS